MGLTENIGLKQLSTLFLIAAGASAQATPLAATKSAAPAAPALEPGLYAIFNTSMGTLTAKLFENETPITVKNFVALAEGTKAWKDPSTKAMVTKPLYNNITFHVVIRRFIIQAGDPTGRGDPDCGFTIKDEIVPSLKFNQPGRLGMANMGAPNTGGCQLFITDVPYPSLNGGYTVFGQVVQGQDVVHTIDNVRTGANNKPVTPVKLISVTIKRVGSPPGATPAKKQAAPGKTGTAASAKKQ